MPAGIRTKALEGMENYVKSIDTDKLILKAMDCGISLINISEFFYYGSPKIDELRNWDFYLLNGEGLQRFYARFPRFSRVLLALPHFILGVVKTLTDPIIEAIGVFVFPIFACLSHGQDRKSYAYAAAIAFYNTVTLGLLVVIYLSSPYTGICLLITSAAFRGIYSTVCGMFPELYTTQDRGSLTSRLNSIFIETAKNKMFANLDSTKPSDIRIAAGKLF